MEKSPGAVLFADPGGLARSCCVESCERLMAAETDGKLRGARTMTAPAKPEVLIRADGRVGRITLNRPEAINALTYSMVGAIWTALLSWKSESAIELVVLDGTGNRGFCAGGDIRALYNSRLYGSAFVRAFLRNEYHLNALIHRYPKPIIAIQDGVVMGGGIGLSAHANHRIVTERSELAMPETGIGFIPDVGGTWLLAHAPGETGLYLGLTGVRMSAADAIYAGFANIMVPVSQIPRLIASLGATDHLDPVVVIQRFAGEPGASELAALRPMIDKDFASDRIDTIIEALGRSGQEWGSKNRAALDKSSPKALALTHAAIRRARHLGSLEEALNIEYRLACRLFEDGEFPEGVRALLIDKDQRPKWKPQRIEDVSPQLVAAYFSPMADELGLKSPAI
jgi:enoyl-CoA hydratase